ncbi:ALDH-like protein [Bimuria novae-zelandiae CBS 107.79]|uniref:ALDH-like protein n=1 Tax=Bimuria novae-zelandiae CBS 107.79 TaxID=1447943 RepID=A0A6A5V750_9PLEO|nr:ALDH-like protein [Bimuria novae-zelandiae CBS 107.79]
MSALVDLHATAVTSRCHNPFFRREQLKSLHDTIRKEKESIRTAIRQDTSCTDAEASVEIATALRIVVEHHTSIQPKNDINEEYKTAHGQDARDRTEPWGVVFVEPNLGHTPFLSVIDPLSAAITAGNCVALKLENTPRAIPSMLRTLLTKAMQADTFQIISTTPTQDALSNAFSVLQKTRIQQPSNTQLVSSSGRVVAVVDRTADLSSAAEALVAARFSFGGTSPYAPDLVFVNEFVKTAFVEKVVGHALRYLASTTSAVVNGTPEPSQTNHFRNKITSTSLTSLESNKDWDTRIITQGYAGAIIELTNKHTTHVPLPPRSNAPVLAISAISSLDHAIDLVANDPGDRLSAAYHFAAAAHANYLSLFIHAQATFINHIPAGLLLGPAAPLFHVINVEKRYVKEHFVRAAPVIVNSGATKGLVHLSSRDAMQLLDDANKEIKEARRAEWIAIGFFEQGILLGLGMYGLPLLSFLGASIFFGVRAGLRRWAVI